MKKSTVAEIFVGYAMNDMTNDTSSYEIHQRIDQFLSIQKDLGLLSSEWDKIHSRMKYRYLDWKAMCGRYIKPFDLQGQALIDAVSDMYGKLGKELQADDVMSIIPRDVYAEKNSEGKIIFRVRPNNIIFVPFAIEEYERYTFMPTIRDFNAEFDTVTDETVTKINEDMKDMAYDTDARYRVIGHMHLQKFLKQ